MTRTLASTLTLLALPLLLAACGPARPVGPAAIVVSEAWSRPAATGGTGAGFFELTNSGGAADTLLAVESPISDEVQIHQSSDEGGVMRMRQVTEGVTVKAGETVGFAPGGLHVMFIRLKAAQVAGDRIPATLVFRESGRKPVELTVRVAGAAPGGDMAHHGH